jgi:hypothetical protein
MEVLMFLVVAGDIHLEITFLIDEDAKNSRRSIEPHMK